MVNKTITLTEFQRWMQNRLIKPVDYSGKGEPAYDIEDIICGSDKLDAEAHLAIYQRGYIARLRHCMSLQFPTLAYALGDDLFRAFADEYLIEYPSSNYNLSKLGKHLSAYLRATRPDKDTEIKEDWPDFMIELADFEYALNEIFEEQAELPGVASPDQRYVINPTLRVFDFKFPVRRYYTQVATGQSPDLPYGEKTYCAALRRQDNYKLNLHDLSRSAFELLSKCLRYPEKADSIPNDIADPWLKAGVLLTLK